jgi:hypothetical protein
MTQHIHLNLRRLLRDAAEPTQAKPDDFTGEARLASELADYHRGKAAHHATEQANEAEQQTTMPMQAGTNTSVVISQGPSGMGGAPPGMAQAGMPPGMMPGMPPQNSAKQELLRHHQDAEQQANTAAKHFLTGNGPRGHIALRRALHHSLNAVTREGALDE